MSWRRGQAYGQDLRDRVLSAGGSIHQVAERFGVSDSYVCRVRARYKRLGETTPGVQCNHVPRRLVGLEEVVKERVASGSDRRVEDLCAWIKAEHGVAVGRATMWKAFKLLGLSFKKRRSMRLNGSGLT